MFDSDRRPLLSIVKQMGKMDKIKNGVYLKEFKQKLKRNKGGRHNQIIHLEAAQGLSA